jgi:luciferase family oxidoreductase group 1
MPRCPGVPELWLLGSGGDSAEYAADLGAGYSYAHFINPDGEAIVEAYRRRFRPSARLVAPKVSIAAFALCAPSEDEAQSLAMPVLHWGLRLLAGEGGGFPSPEEVKANAPNLTGEDIAAIKARQAQGAIGTPEQVRDKLLALWRSYGVDEIAIVTIVHDFAARKRSYELLANAFELPGLAA